MNVQLGKWVIIIGVTLTIFGIVTYFFSDWLNWLGKLPGDFRYENKNVKIYVPLTSMVLVSLIISLLIRVLQKINQ